MKRILPLPLLAALAVFVSACNKQPTEAEKNAEVERQVQQRLEAEHQADEQQKLAQRQAEIEAREQALAAKENRPASTATPAATAPPPVRANVPNDSETGSYSTFYRKLDPFGDWMETADYGYVFQPHQATQARDWRPYTNGHWVYTDAGWTWISNEPFGWATYHYGRWVRLRSTGWVWVPGEQWAPAWVSWRKGNEFVGWAPLPPEAHFDREIGIRNWADNYYDIGPEQYAFVPAKEFGGQLSSTAIVATTRNVTIINQTTNVTNITYNNSVIVDRGPSYDDLRAGSSQPIERFRLERTQNFNDDRPVIRGEVVALPAVDFHPAERPARPARVARTIAQPVVERGWAGIQDAPAAQKARDKMQAETTPPPNLPPRKFVRPDRPAMPPRPAAVNVATPAASAAPISTPMSTPAATAKPVPPRAIVPATPRATAEAAQPSPAENTFSPKHTDRNRHEAAKAVREKMQKERLEEQERRRTERQQGRQGHRDRQPNETPAATATPPPAATVAPQTTPPVTASPAPIATATPNAPGAHERTGDRRTQQAERRAQKQQRMEGRRGKNSGAPGPTPSETQTPAPAASPSPVATP